MKQDEYEIYLTESFSHLHPKREKWIKKKWSKQGLYNNGFTQEFYKIQSMCKEEYKLEKYTDTVCEIYFIDGVWFRGKLVGYLEDNGDYGDSRIYSVANAINSKKSYLSSTWGIKDHHIAYIKECDNVNNIWRKLNYYMYKNTKVENFFHDKCGDFTGGRMPDEDENLKHGECRSSCFCKKLDKK